MIYLNSLYTQAFILGLQSEIGTMIHINVMYAMFQKYEHRYKIYYHRETYQTLQSTALAIRIVKIKTVQSHLAARFGFVAWRD